jgi:hypothetical protein
MDPKSFETTNQNWSNSTGAVWCCEDSGGDPRIARGDFDLPLTSPVSSDVRSLSATYTAAPCKYASYIITKNVIDSLRM